MSLPRQDAQIAEHADKPPTRSPGVRRELDKRGLAWVAGDAASPTAHPPPTNRLPPPWITERLPANPADHLPADLLAAERLSAKPPARLAADRQSACLPTGCPPVPPTSCLPAPHAHRPPPPPRPPAKPPARLLQDRPPANLFARRPRLPLRWPSPTACPPSACPPPPHPATIQHPPARRGGVPAEQACRKACPGRQSARRAKIALCAWAAEATAGGLALANGPQALRAADLRCLWLWVMHDVRVTRRTKGGLEDLGAAGGAWGKSGGHLQGPGVPRGAPDVPKLLCGGLAVRGAATGGGSLGTSRALKGHPGTFKVLQIDPRASREGAPQIGRDVTRVRAAPAATSDARARPARERQWASRARAAPERRPRPSGIRVASEAAREQQPPQHRESPSVSEEDHARCTGRQRKGSTGEHRTPRTDAGAPDSA